MKTFGSEDQKKRKKYCWTNLHIFLLTFSWVCLSRKQNSQQMYNNRRNEDICYNDREIFYCWLLNNELIHQSVFSPPSKCSFLSHVWTHVRIGDFICWWCVLWSLFNHGFMNEYHTQTHTPNEITNFDGNLFASYYTFGLFVASGIKKCVINSPEHH